MKFTVEYPLERQDSHPEFRRPENLARIARAVEEARFSAILFSEHPAPSRKWLAAGGHHTFDPVSALSFCAAITSRIQLMTNLLVLPYRNPWLTAKAMSTVDLLSGGRLIAVGGTGYMRSEFAALGVDFTERNHLFDEAVEMINLAWSAQPVTFNGRHFQALDQQLQPPPAQPHFPLWIGGNSKLARSRVVRYGYGWSAMFGHGPATQAVRTAALETVEELAAAVNELRDGLAAAGRDVDTVEVQVEAPSAAIPAGDPEHEQHLDRLAALAEAGVTRVIVHLPGDSVEAAVDAIKSYGEQFIEVMGASPVTDQVSG